MELALSGLTGMSKVLARPGNDLYDVDAYVSDIDEDEEHRHYPNIGTSYTEDTVELESGGSTPRSSTQPNNYVKKETDAVPLDPLTDPFAPRTGKTLLWRNINMTLTGKKGKPDRKLLTGVWGEVPKTETTAIMGASGAGKTSLLNILAGRVSSNKHLRIEADVRLNNYSVDPTNINVRKNIAFVAQDDSLQATSTPRECIRFSAKLRLPRSTTEEQLDQVAQRMVDELGLTSCADTIVGGPLIKGISGGERKRASVGVELVVRPAMVFLDEPTSGLDSFSAVQVCQVLKKVANAGSSVLFTIHQPNSEIFSSFDRLILMHKGRVLYQGPTHSIDSHYGSRGYPIPKNYNPADWVIDVAQRYPPAQLAADGFFPGDERLLEQPFIPTKGQDPLGLTTHIKQTDNDERTPDAWVQAKMLFTREMMFLIRFPAMLEARYGVSAFLSIIVGVIFYKVGETDPGDTFNLQSQFGAMMILMIFAMMGCAQPAIMFFPEERPIFVREYSTNHYSIMPYFLSKLLIEAFITGFQMLLTCSIVYNMVKFRGAFYMFFFVTYTLAMSSTAIAVCVGVASRGNVKVAQQMLPVVLLPQFMFSGFFVSPQLIPPVLRWVQYICVLTYAVRILVSEEFYNCSDDYFAQTNCLRLAENVNAVPDETWWNWIVLIVLFFAFRSLALFLLKRGASKFY